MAVIVTFFAQSWGMDAGILEECCINYVVEIDGGERKDLRSTKISVKLSYQDKSKERGLVRVLLARSFLRIRK